MERIEAEQIKKKTGNERKENEGREMECLCAYSRGLQC